MISTRKAIATIVAISVTSIAVVKFSAVVVEKMRAKLSQGADEVADLASVAPDPAPEVVVAPAQDQGQLEMDQLDIEFEELQAQLKTNMSK